MTSGNEEVVQKIVAHDLDEALERIENTISLVKDPRLLELLGHAKNSLRLAKTLNDVESHG